MEADIEMDEVVQGSERVLKYCRKLAHSDPRLGCGILLLAAAALVNDKDHFLTGAGRAWDALRSLQEQQCGCDEHARVLN